MDLSNRFGWRNPIAASLRFLALCLMVAFSAVAASAQPVDWLVNIDDAGFDPSPSGGTIDYVIEVTNNGPNTAGPTQLRFTVPPTTALSGTIDGAGIAITGCTPNPATAGQEVVCDVPTLAIDETASFTAQIDTSAATVVELTASVDDDGNDTSLTNNTLTEQTTITAGADLGIDLVLPATAPAGSRIPITATVQNFGPNTADAYQVQFPVPPGLVDFTLPAGCSLAGGTITCNVTTDLTVGPTVVFNFEAQVGVSSTSDITATASVGGGTPPDPNAANNASTDTMLVTAGTDLEVSIARNTGANVLAGEEVDFTISSSYTGDEPSNIEITHTVPSEFTIDTISAPGWTIAQVGNQLTFTRANGAGAGADIDLGAILIETTATTPGTAVSSVAISSTGAPEQNLANNSDSVTTTVAAAVVDLEARKTGPNPPVVVVGNPYTFRLRTENVGNADFFGTIVMTDTLPAGLTLDSIGENGWSCAPVPAAALPLAGPATIECTLVYTAGAPLEAGDRTRVVELNTTVTAAGTITNIAATASPDANIPDTNPANDTDDDVVTATPPGASADITVNKTPALDPLVAGSVQTYTLEVVNLGPAQALSVELTDTFLALANSSDSGADAGYLGETITAGPNATGLVCSSVAAGAQSRTLSCDIATLDPCTPGTAGSATACPIIEVQVRHGTDAGTINNTAEVISDVTADPDLTNNEGSSSFTQTPLVDITVEKTVSADPIPAGQDVTFVIAASVVDDGLSDADNVTITDTLPQGVRFISATPVSGSCTTTPNAGDIITAANDQVVCNLGTIPNGAQRTVAIVVEATNAQIGSAITNNVAVTTTTPENDVEPNTAAVSTNIVGPDTDLIINKDDSVDPLVVGTDTVYTITVTNAGPSSSEDIVVTDTLPPTNVSFQSVIIPNAATNGGVCTTIPPANSFGQTLVCEFPFLAAGDSVTVEVTGRGDVAGDVFNSVSVSSFEILNGFDRLAANNQTDEITTVRVGSDISLPTKTPSSASVAVGEDFTFDVTVVVGATTGPAENVVVTDNLPTNMVLTGTPTTPFLASACTGGAGDTSFVCNLGTVPTNTTLTISVPVEVVATTTSPEVFTNTATVTTTSLDSDPTDNSASGSVTVGTTAGTSSIAGTVFRDFVDDAVLNGNDTGIAGLSMTLTGTAASDGTPITRNVVTDANGDYLFDNLPEGTYTVTRDVPAEPALSDGTNTVGSEGGVLSGATAITTIPLPDATDAVDYDFALIPQAAIGLSKILSSQTTAVDGSFIATFDLVVENLSLEELINISVTDPLAGGSPLFGTLVTPGDPVNDALADGTYAIVAAPTGSCAGLNAGFDGSGDQVLATGFSLTTGATCTVSFQIRVQPTDPLPPTLGSGGEYENQATTEGTGADSGQTPSDLSDDGTVIDPDGDNNANEAGENDPTPVPISQAPAIALVKTADTSALSTPAVAGEVITYNFAITNTGNVTLTNVTLVENLIGATLIGGPIPSLTPGATDSTTFTATYALTPADITAGQVINQATTTGTPPTGPDVTDDSGTTTTDDIPTTTLLASGPGIALVKTADASALSNPPQVGDVISYSFEVTNLGNVTLSNVTIVDSLPGAVVSGSPIASLAPGAVDSTSITATYALTADDLTAGVVDNIATVTGEPPSGPPVNDIDTASVPLNQSPGIDLVKTITDSTDLLDGADVGDVITYGFTITNTGNVPLRNVVLDDALVGVAVSGGPIALMNPAAVGDGTDVDSTTFTATYTLDAADVANGGRVTNTATATGTWGPLPGATVSASSSVTASPPNPGDGLVISKTTPDDVVRRGTLVPYTIRFQNNNAFAVGPLDIVDNLPDGFLYVDGTAQLDGVDFPVTVSGNTVTFAGVTVPAATEVVATLTARILNGTNPGEYTNRALALDPLFGVVAGPATATVRILPEAVFDCGDVVGRVFDDLDGDGYQDSFEPGVNPPEISDQTYYGAKVEDEPLPEPTEERGLPGVRLHTLDGLIITTDENGLFSVPCAALPADAGSNFLLSLDTRSLPAGFEMTTENPRVMRLTPGMLTEMNFGARLARVVRVDLSDHAFTSHGALDPGLEQGLGALIAHLRDTPSNVALIYHVPADAGPDVVAAARARMDLVEAEIGRQWSEVGRGRLGISQAIARAE